MTRPNTYSEKAAFQLNDRIVTRPQPEKCNPPLALNDLTVISQSLKAKNGFKLITSWRGTIVVVRRWTATERWGAAAVATGAACILWQNLRTFNPAGIGITLLVVGALLVCYKKLAMKNMAADQTFKLGYDIGKEDGAEEQRRETDLRPQVVPISSRLCTDCKTKRSEPTVNAVPRSLPL